jgi:hypothetical protein
VSQGRGLSMRTLVSLAGEGCTGPMSTLIAALVRVVVMAAALAGYYEALPYLFPDAGGGANIGAGLIAFGALVLVSFGWAFVDGTARDISPTIIIWTIAAAVVSVGWLVARAVAEADAGTSATEIVTHDLGTLPFTMGLVLAPAALGAAIGHGLRPSQARWDRPDSRA